MSDDSNTQGKLSFVSMSPAPVQIDKRLVTLRRVGLSIEMNKKIKTEGRRIRFENRMDLNGTAASALLLQMEVECTNEWAGKLYEIYCDVWKTQGQRKTSHFIQSYCRPAIMRLIEVRTGSASHQYFISAATRSVEGRLRDAYLKDLKLQMVKLVGSWKRKLEIEARECEQAERTSRQSVDGSTGPSFLANVEKIGPERKMPIDDKQRRIDGSAVPSLSASLEQDRTKGNKSPSDDRLQLVIKKVQNPQNFRMLRIKETALYFGVTQRTIRRWIEEGKLRGRLVPRGTVTIESVISLEKKKSRRPRRP